MSGIYIKGMEMPKDCKNCPMLCDYSCRVLQLEPDWGKSGRDDRCHLIPVPPHGRLIDADALMEIIKAHDYPLRAHFNSTDNGMFTIGIQQVVDELPTIIPADGGAEC